MIDLIKIKLAEANINFPGYGERDDKTLILQAKLFAKHLAQYPPHEVEKAFDSHLVNGKEFPKIADIAKHFLRVKAYRLDHGPLGYGAVYADDHPYVRQQMAIPRNDLSGCIVEVLASEVDTPDYLPLPEVPEDPAPQIASDGGGFRLINCSKISPTGERR